MQDYEKLGVFYLGKEYDLAAQQLRDDLLLYDSKDLVTHAVCVGMTGSGKTGLCIALIEEAAIDHVPAILIDPKGDLANLLLTFPELRGEDFLPWINEEDAAKKAFRKKEIREGIELYTGKEAEAGALPRKKGVKKAVRKMGKTELTVPKAIKRRIKVGESITVGELAKKMGIKFSDLAKKLMGLGIMATINHPLDYDSAVLVATDPILIRQSTLVMTETMAALLACLGLPALAFAAWSFSACSLAALASACCCLWALSRWTRSSCGSPWRSGGKRAPPGCRQGGFLPMLSQPRPSGSGQTSSPANADPPRSRPRINFLDAPRVLFAALILGVLIPFTVHFPGLLHEKEWMAIPIAVAGVVAVVILFGSRTEDTGRLV